EVDLSGRDEVKSGGAIEARGVPDDDTGSADLRGQGRRVGGLRHGGEAASEGGCNGGGRDGGRGREAGGGGGGELEVVDEPHDEAVVVAAAGPLEGARR